MGIYDHETGHYVSSTKFAEVADKMDFMEGIAENMRTDGEALADEIYEYLEEK